MKIIISMFGAIFMLHSANFAQSTSSFKKVMALKITTDRGADGAGVVWHPIQKKYYAAMIGDKSFQMAVFDINGKQLSADTLTTKTDLRGMWYNPTLKTIQSNAYSSGGWNEYKLNNRGMPIGIRPILSGINQPDDHAVGTYNPVTNQVYFLSYFDEEPPTLVVHNMKEGEYGQGIIIHLRNDTGDTSKDEYLNSTYNTTTALYTGLPKKEIALANRYENEIEFYDLKTGFMTETVSLPEGTKIEEMFSFAYANGIFWFFNKADREWVGYK